MLRKAGTGRFGNGDRLVWTVAEGAKGRRWRWTHTNDIGIVAVGLLELDEDGRPMKLELAGPAGMLTLHPSGDERELHGNVASPQGMRHIRVPWTNAHVLIVEGEALVAAAMCHRLAKAIGPGGETELRAVVVEPGYALRDCRVRVQRDGPERWRMDASPHPKVRLAIDADGAPVGMRDEASWALEDDSAA
jgi:hypothetical protein